MASELRVFFQPDGEGWKVRLVPAAAAGAPAALPLTAALSEKDYEDLRWYLEDYLDLPDYGSRVRAGRIENDLRRWGRELYRALFGDGDHRAMLDELRRARPPRLLTLATDESELLRLPWELLADREGPLSRQGITIRRQLETPKTGRRRRLGLPLRLLVVVSRPADLGFIDPRATTPAMLDALDPLGGQVTVDFCRPPTLARLEAMLAKARDEGRPYQVVHFEGHGTFLKEIGLGALYFERPGGEVALPASDAVRADRLGTILAGYRAPVVVLEACRTSMTGKVPAFRSVAPRLVEAGVGSVVAMSHAVHVQATRILLERFYRELVAGKTLGQALEAGRGALLADAHRWVEAGPRGRTVELRDWFLPTLYQQGEDPRLVPDGRTPAKAKGQTAPAAEAAAGTVAAARRRPPERGAAGAFPRPPIYRFQGRARELYQLEGHLRSHRAVLLHAMGGMGKTALAREAAYWWTRTGLFPDGACFVSFEQGGGAERVAQVVGSTLEGHAFEALPAAEQLERARQLFAEREVLVVWDNFESVLPAFAAAEGEAVPLYSDDERGRLVELYRDWTESPRGRGRLLVTCRPAEAGLPGARRMELEGLGRPDSLHLLARVLAVHGVGLEDPRLGREALDELLDLLADHPLSIELVAPHLKEKAPGSVVAEFGALLEKFEGAAEVGRNRSLLASLEFSLGRLGAAARQALPWLGLFRGGVFEEVLLRVSELDPGLWEAARQELEDTALVRVERDILYGSGEGRPYLRFHPTLAWRAAAAAPASEEVRRRFVGVYLGVRGAVDRAFFGSNPRSGLEVMVREEANFRRAVAWALAAGAWGEASTMGATFGNYLRMSGRLRERDAWAARLAAEVAKGGFSAAAAARERDAAWALFTQGRAGEAVARLEALLARLGKATDFDPAVEIAAAQMVLGRIFAHSGQSPRAIPVLEESVQSLEALAAAATARGETAEAERGNLSTALGSLANASMGAGRLSEALEAAERGLAIDRELGHERDLAAGLVQTAQILAQQGRFDDADRRYGEALDAARRAGDRELEALALQSRGGLARQRGRLDQAAGLYRRALKLFQDMGNDGAVMETCNLLGVVEQQAGRLAEARAWYHRSREIAEGRGDEEALAIAAQNLGIVLQQEGEAAREQGDDATARRRLEEAVEAVEGANKLDAKMGNEPNMAMSHSQLGRIHLLLGDLDRAEEHAHRAREIRERLGLKEAWKDYATLADIARARGDDAAVAGWEKKRDDLLAELKRRAGGGSGLPPETVQAIGHLAVACARAGLDRGDLPPPVEATLHQLAGAPPPLDALVPFLRALAAGEDAAVPEGLPGELRQLLAGVLAAVAEAR